MSSCTAPICPVKKKDGTMRLCIDYRQLNARTKNDTFSTGNVLDFIDNMAGARYFSTIGLAQGYHQVPVAEADRDKPLSVLHSVSGNLLGCRSG